MRPLGRRRPPAPLQGDLIERPELVAAIKPHVWRTLTLREQERILAIDDCNVGRYSTAELRRRLSEIG